MYQDLAWQVSLLGILLVAAAFLFVVLRSGNPADYGPIQKRFYRFRTIWFLLLLGIGSWLSVETLSDLPYAATHGDASKPAAAQVDVTGHQWYWEMSRTEFPVNHTIEFRVTASDVNHSFAIFNEDDKVVTQTQAMPGYTNKLRHSFDEPGTYRVMCLEYCGVAHHDMTREIRVTTDDKASEE